MDDLNTLFDALLIDEPGSEKFTNAVDSLAALSREQETVRSRLASTDVLQRLLKVLESSTRGLSSQDRNLLATTLRCVGNACVSTPNACQTVTAFGFGWCEKYLTKRFRMAYEEDGSWHAHLDEYDSSSPEIRSLTIKVLYNICSQSESAQKQCYHDNIHSPFLRILASGDPPADDLSLMIDLLLWITSHHKELASFEGETARKRALNNDQVLDSDTFWALVMGPCDLQSKLDIEDWASLLEVTLVFLRDPAGYQQTISQEKLNCVWRMLVINERKAREVEGNPDDHKLLVALSTSLTWALSDISATPLFAEVYMNPDPMSKEAITIGDDHIPQLLVLLGDWSEFLGKGAVRLMHHGQRSEAELKDGDSLRLTTAVCQIIGNLLHNHLPIENTVHPAIREQRIHERLLSLMATSDNADFLHSAAGLLIQLSRPSPEAREEIASDSNALLALRRLGQHTMSELNQDALRLMRALGKDTPSVQEQFKELAGEVMATVAETQQATANAQSGQPQLTSTS